MRNNGAEERGLRKVWHVSSYAVGFALDGGVGQVLTAYWMPFLIFAMGMNPLLAGLAAGLSKVWDGIIDPTIGMLVDRTNTRWGKCRPWLLASVVPVFASYVLLWTNLGIQGQWGKFFYFIFAYMLFSTASSIGIVPYDALLPRMVDDYNRRTDYTSYRLVFSGIANVASTYIYNALIHAEAPSDYPVQTHNFLILGIVLGAMFALPLLITFLGSKETFDTTGEARCSFRETFMGYKEILQSKLYRNCFGITLLGTFAGHAFVVTFMTFVLLVYGDIQYQLPLLGAASLSFLTINLKGVFEIGFFVPNVIMMKKRSKHSPLFADLPLFVFGLLILLFVTPKTPVWVFLLGISIAGAGSSCLTFVPNTLLPDLCDVDELIYGKRREGISAGFTKMGRQVMQGLAGLLFGLLLGAFGLGEDQAITPAAAGGGAVFAVKLMMCVIPIISVGAMFMLARRYNLDADSHGKIKACVAQKRAHGAVTTAPREKSLFEDITGQSYDRLWIAETSAQRVAQERRVQEQRTVPVQAAAFAGGAC